MGAFVKGILQGTPFQEARWIGEEITPEIVVLHDTASRLSIGSAANYLRSNDRKVSVHFVIERDGGLVQQVPVDKRANHAGRSSYHGRSGCNGFSIGIEIVSPGRLTRYSETHAAAWYGEKFDIAVHGIQEITTPEHGAGLWMPYTEGQISTVIALCQSLFGEIDTLHDITTHWYVSPGRKVDPGPLFPLEQVRSTVFGREEPRDDEAEAGSSGSVSRREQVRINASGGLNMRRWPSFNPNVIAVIPDGVVVPVLRSGVFAGFGWHLVQFNGQEGWVVASYADPIVFRDAV